MTDLKSAGNIRRLIILVGATLLLVLQGCGENSSTPPTLSVKTAETDKTTIATGIDLVSLPNRGKTRQAEPPAKAVIGMIYFNTTDNREYIFDGKQWVPHDMRVDNFYEKNRLEKIVGYPGGPYSAGHNKHTAFTCVNCHITVNMVVYFFTDASSRAYITPTADNPNPPIPVYNGNMFVPATPKTCSNIACHGVSRGTFAYYFMGGDGEPELKMVEYGGTYQVTPPWGSTSTGCTTCHGNPPNSGAWHSGYHGGQGPAGTYNQCQFCHPDASGSNGSGTAITNPALHADGAVNVQVVFKSSCFNCH